MCSGNAGAQCGNKLLTPYGVRFALKKDDVVLLVDGISKHKKVVRLLEKAKDAHEHEWREQGAKDAEHDERIRRTIRQDRSDQTSN